ncbi:MAG: yajC [Verrucomicrobiales bacterium]|nr:yajC [Verrucomicrobiales bacterium]
MTATFLPLLAQTTAPAGQSSLGLLMPLLLIVMFYFMLIRPQRRQQKEQMARLAALKTGDEVIAAGGIHGLITNVSERTVTLKIADGVKIKIEKASVVTILKKSDEPEVIQTEVVSS